MLTEDCGKLGGATRAQAMLRAATHMIAARQKIKPWLLFRMSRTSDMCTPHCYRMILPPFQLADKVFFRFVSVAGIFAFAALSGGTISACFKNPDADIADIWNRR